MTRATLAPRPLLFVVLVWSLTRALAPTSTCAPHGTAGIAQGHPSADKGPELDR